MTTEAPNDPIVRAAARLLHAKLPAVTAVTCERHDADPRLWLTAHTTALESESMRAYAAFLRRFGGALPARLAVTVAFDGAAFHDQEPEAGPCRLVCRCDPARSRVIPLWPDTCPPR